ncbi:MAG: hypothetical protein HQL66_09330 [Magnetococcales bacterium]|nr:hypothetical protein [Magnetococcales bacterium]
MAYDADKGQRKTRTILDRAMRNFVRDLVTSHGLELDPTAVTATLQAGKLRDTMQAFADWLIQTRGDEKDELYDEAIDIILRARKVSASMIQRYFKIGYNRASRIVERMEKDGLVSESNSQGKREVLVSARPEQVRGGVP